MNLRNQLFQRRRHVKSSKNIKHSLYFSSGTGIKDSTDKDNVWKKLKFFTGSATSLLTTFLELSKLFLSENSLRRIWNVFKVINRTWELIDVKWSERVGQSQLYLTHWLTTSLLISYNSWNCGELRRTEASCYRTNESNRTEWNKVK